MGFCGAPLACPSTLSDDPVSCSRPLQMLIAECSSVLELGHRSTQTPHNVHESGRCYESSSSSCLRSTYVRSKCRVAERCHSFFSSRLAPPQTRGSPGLANDHHKHQYLTSAMRHLLHPPNEQDSRLGKHESSPPEDERLHKTNVTCPTLVWGFDHFAAYQRPSGHSNPR